MPEETPTSDEQPVMAGQEAAAGTAPDGPGADGPPGCSDDAPAADEAAEPDVVGEGGAADGEVAGPDARGDRTVEVAAEPAVESDAPEEVVDGGEPEPAGEIRTGAGPAAAAGPGPSGDEPPPEPVPPLAAETDTGRGGDADEGPAAADEPAVESDGERSARDSDRERSARDSDRERSARDSDRERSARDRVSPVPDTVPEPTVPDLTEPDLTVPDLTEPDLTEPDLTEPDLTVPDLTEVVPEAAAGPPVVESEPLLVEPEPKDPAGGPHDLTPRKRLLVAMRPRATRAQVLAMVLCFVLGLAGFLAVRQNQSLGLDSMRQSDLVSLLDNVTERSARVEDETHRLQAMADQLQSGSDQSAAALEAAQQRLEQLGILAGTSPAVGPGIQLTITDPQRKVSAATVLDAVEELRDAGAEAIQIGEARVVASTAFVNGNQGVRIDGVDVHRPYVLLVIGDPQTLASALDIPGGVLEVLKQDGATGTVETRQTVTVSAVRPVAAPQYARPDGSASP